jgi:hypothetical protein
MRPNFSHPHKNGKELLLQNIGSRSRVSEYWIQNSGISLNSGTESSLYLYGQEVLLRTDNAAVSWVRSLKNPSGQVARWLQELGNYNLNVTHRPGRQHKNADALSRSPCKTCSRQSETYSPPIQDECETLRAVTRGQASGGQSNVKISKHQFI